MPSMSVFCVQSYRLLGALFVSALLLSSLAACRSSKSSGGSYEISPKQARATSYSKAASRARFLMREGDLGGLYQLNEASVYDRGSSWKVCFPPREGKGMPRRKRCIEIEK